MTIHFVCYGNVYRSRLAEAYFNSKKITNVTSISSGIVASINENRPISWLTQRLFEVYKLVPFEKSNWTQTTKQLLDSADLTIFFDKIYFEFCVENFDFHSENYEIWDIKDLDENIKEYEEKMRTTEETFILIRQKVDDLIERKKLLK
jgi:protein-tyrosine-phosphatase